MAAAAPGQLNFDPVPGGCRVFDSFEKLELLGQGTYGEVSKARDKRTGEIVALKKLKLAKENYDKEGFPITAIREIKILNKFRHDNIIDLKEIVTSYPGPGESGGEIYMAFEYMDHDLTGLVNKEGAKFTVPQIKCYMKQLLLGLHYCHANGVLHRDIKSSNLFLNNQGSLKLGDFGLARTFSAQDHENAAGLTSQVVTLWYRPPELLLGATKYGPSVDTWSVGCIFAELLCRGRPIFSSTTEAGVMSKIVEVCGVPDEANWPGVSKLPLYDKFLKTEKQQQKPIRPLSEMFRHWDRHAVELLEKLLTLDPSKRVSAREALDADYFWTEPYPCEAKSLPSYKSAHELDFKNDFKRMQERLQAKGNVAKLQKPQDRGNVAICEKPVQCQQKPEQYQQQHLHGNPPPKHQHSEQVETREQPHCRELDIRNEPDMKKRKEQQPLQDEENVAKHRKPVWYQEQRPRGIPPPKHKQSEVVETREQHYRHELDVRNEYEVRKRKQEPLQDEENVAKRQKPVQYQHQHPRGSPPPKRKQYEQEESREQPYRPKYCSRSPVATRPRHCFESRPGRCYESRPPRLSYEARRYYQNDRYASGRDSMRDGRRNWRY